MRLKAVAIALLTIAICAQAEDGATKCRINYNLTQIKDDVTDVFVTFESSESNKITSLKIQNKSDSNPYVDYFEIVTDPQSGLFAMKPTPAFVSFEIDNAVTSVAVQLRAQCTDGTTADEIVTFAIVDTNNHAPIFDRDAYVFELAMPFTAGMRIDVCDNPQTFLTTDHDTTAIVRYRIEPSADFEVRALPQVGKTFPAVIRSRRLLKLTEDTTYTIFASDGEHAPTATLTIKVPPEQYTPSPRFTHAFDIFDYDRMLEANGNFDVPMVDGAKVTARIDDSDGYFVAKKVADNVVRIESSRPLPDAVLTTNTFLAYELLAEYEGEVVAKTAIIVRLAEQGCPTTEASTTTNSDCPSCPTTTVTECPPSSTTTITECPPYSTTTVTECPTSSATTINSDCPPCPSTTDCPITSTTTTETPLPPPPPSTIDFDKPMYTFRVDPTFKGQLAKIRATARPPEDIDYHVEGNQHPGIDYALGDGALAVTDPLPSGVYAFVVVAAGAETANVARTTVVIGVSAVAFCGDEPRFAVAYALKRAPENEAVTIAIASDPPDPEYRLRIVDVYPRGSDDDGPFKIDAEGNVRMESVDREDPIFRSLPVPQYRLTIEIAEPDDSSWRVRFFRRESVVVYGRNLTRNVRPADEDVASEDVDRLQCVAMPSKIDNYLRQTVVTVLIDDANDNHPEFVDGERAIFGYPERRIADRIRLPHVGSVRAVDRDVGAHAAVRYAIESSTGGFAIGPDSGTIYRTEGDLREDARFVVSATDEYGRGLKSTIDVEVRVLRADQVFVLRLTDVFVEDVDRKLAEIGRATGMRIRKLAASMATDDDESRARSAKRSGITAHVRVIAYATTLADPTTGDLQFYSNDAVEKALDEANDASGFDDIATYIESDVCDCQSAEEEDDDDGETTFIIVIGVLATLLAAFIIVFVVIYFLKLRKTNNLVFTTGPPYGDGDDDSNRTSVSSKKLRRPTGFVFAPPTTIDEEEEEKAKDEEDFNIKYVDETVHQQVRDLHPSGDVDEDGGGSGGKEEATVDGVEARERKKSVSFVGMVERIHIDDDEEEEAGDGAKDSDSDDRDSERQDDEEVVGGGEEDKVERFVF